MDTVDKYLGEVKNIGGYYISYKGKLYGPWKSYEGLKERIRLSGDKPAIIVTYDHDELKYISDPSYKGEEGYKDPKKILPIEKFTFPSTYSYEFMVHELGNVKLKFHEVFTPAEIKKLRRGMNIQ